MQRNSTWKLLGTTLFLTLCATTLAIFICYPGAISHMQGAVLYDIALLPAKLSRFPFAAFLWNTLTAFAGVVFFGISCVSLGMRLFNNFHRLEQNQAASTHPQTRAYIATSFLIGNAVFSLVLLVFATLSKITPLLSLFVLCLGLLSGLGQFRRLIFPFSRRSEGQGKIAAILSVAILAVSLFQSSARISYDASAIYFSNAKLTALEQKVNYYTENAFVVSVFHSAINFTAVSQIFGDQSARMITWLFGLVNIAIVYAIAEQVAASPLARRLLLALILTTTAFLDLMGDGKVDLISSAYALGAIYWFILKAKDPNQSPLLFILSGSFIGFACILRPYNAFLLGLFVLIHIVQSLSTGSIILRNAIKQIVWLALGAFGFAVYHLLVNKILLGSPFAFWANVVSINPVDGPWDFDPKTVWLERILYPIVATFKNSPSSLGSITPLVLIFLALLGVTDIRKRIVISKDLRNLSYSTGITLYAWIFLFFTIAEIRYVIFLWLILFIPIAEIAASAFNTKIVLIRNFIKGIVVLLMVFILTRSAYISTVKYSPVDSEGNPQCIDDVLCDHFSSINEIAKKNERVLTLSAFRYYLRTDLFACSTTVEEYGTLRELSHTDKEAFWREVYRLGYSYVAFEEDYTTRHLGFSDSHFAEPPEWVKLTPILVASESLNIVAYELDAINPPVKAETICREDETGIWRLQQR